MKIILLIISSIVLVKAEGPFPTKCKASDSNCLKQAAVTAIPIIAAGFPQYNIERLDPFIAERIDATTANLKLILKNVTITGLTGCKAKKVQFDTEKHKINVKILCDVNFDGKYSMKGSILILPIEGDGNLYVDAKKFQLNFDIDTENVVKGGKTHLKIKNHKFTFDIKAQSKVQFTNLFNGNELLSNAANQLISNNGNDVIREIGPKAITTVADKIIHAIKQLFDIIPYDDLFL